MKGGYLLTIIMTTLLLIGCDHQTKEPEKNTGKYAPVLNPHPKYFMTVKGKIDPALKGQVTLIWKAGYETANTKCQRIVNSLEGISESREKDIIYTAQPGEDGKYIAEIPLDGINPGFCRWKISFLSYTVGDIKENIFAFFLNKYSDIKNHEPMNLIKCDSYGNCRYKRIENFNNSRLLQANKNYQYGLNLTR